MPPLSYIGRISIAVGLRLAPLLLAGQLSATQLAVTTIDFAPRVTTKLQRYGPDEGSALQTAILAAVSRETRRVATPEGLSVTVTVQDIAPTHPTRKQMSDDPAVDTVRTKYLGGADLVGYVRDASQHVVATVSYRHFAPTLIEGSASLDPWADARLAIDQFAAKLAAACHDLLRSGNS
ncbi:MAG TPA: hypothetical protein VGD47_06485 [Steroidobacteraceae bacterium]